MSLTRSLWLRAVYSAAVFCTGPAPQAQEIWFSPPPKLSAQNPGADRDDFIRLFDPNAPWTESASRVSVFEVVDGYASAGPSVDLAHVYADLGRRHITLAVGLSPLTGHGPGGCGYHVEGHSAPGDPLRIARRIKELGGQPKYFSMDEPFYFGHIFDNGGQEHPEAVGCHTSIKDIARDVAMKVAQLRAVFPNVQFGDAEPLNRNVSLAELAQWFDAFHETTGDELAFFRLDMDWAGDWRQRVPDLVQILHRRGIRLQVIYNGKGNDPSDEAWVGRATAHYREFEVGAGIRPDAAVITSWTVHPMRILPETDPTTLTGLMLQYVEWQHSRGGN